jgi:hypothetical protein
MGLSIKDTAPSFEAGTTRAPINSHGWLGDSRALFIARPVTNEHEEARRIFGHWKEPKPCGRIFPQPA